MSTHTTQENHTAEELDPGEHIRYLRDKAGYTQKQLADAVGVHHRTIANYEGGRRIPRGKLEQIVEVLTGERPPQKKGQVIAEQEVFAIRVKGKVVYRVTIQTEQMDSGTTLELGV